MCHFCILLWVINSVNWGILDWDVWETVYGVEDVLMARINVGIDGFAGRQRAVATRAVGWKFVPLRICHLRCNKYRSDNGQC